MEGPRSMRIDMYELQSVQEEEWEIRGRTARGIDGCQGGSSGSVLCGLAGGSGEGTDDGRGD
jgi:hypothetical protein